MYGGDEFEKEVLDYIVMVDVACKTADADTLKKMQTHFTMSCKLERKYGSRNEPKWRLVSRVINLTLIFII